MSDRDLRYRGRERLRRVSFIAPQLAAPDLKHQELFLPSPSGSSTEPTLSDAIRPVSARPDTLSKPKAAPEVAPRATPVGTGAAPKKRTRAERAQAKTLYINGLEVDRETRWLTLEQLADYLGTSPRSLKTQSVRENWVKLRQRRIVEVEQEQHRKRAEKWAQAGERLEEGTLALAQRLLEEALRSAMKPEKKRKARIEDGGDPEYSLPERTAGELAATLIKLVTFIARFKDQKTFPEPGRIVDEAIKAESLKADEATLALARKLEEMDPEQAVRYVEAVFGPSPAGARKIEANTSSGSAPLRGDPSNPARSVVQIRRKEGGQVVSY